MSTKLSIMFPSQASRLKLQAEIERDWTATQRIAAVAESLDLVRSLAAAGGRSAGQLEYQQRCKQQWRQQMKEFLAKHSQHASPSTDG